MNYKKLSLDFFTKFDPENKHTNCPVLNGMKSALEKTLEERKNERFENEERAIAFADDFFLPYKDNELFMNCSMANEVRTDLIIFMTK